MEHLAHLLTNEKVWWHKTLWWRNISARMATFYTFMLEGAFIGVWSFYLEDIEDNLNLSDSELGTAVLFQSLGMVMISTLTAYLLRTLGCGQSTFIGAICFGISMSFIPFANSLGLLIFTMLVFGFATGIMDISMNSGAILVEIVEGKPLMGSFHGSYSVAAAIASLVGGALKTTSLSIYDVYIGMSCISVVTTMVFHSNLYNLKQEQVITEFKDRVSVDCSQYSPLLSGDDSVQASLSNESPLENVPENVDDIDHVSSSASRPKWIIAFYSMVGFLGAFGESSVVTWSIVYFDREMNASSVMKSLGFTCFMVCMAVGRFGCDTLRNKFGRRWIVRAGGVFATTGLGLVALSPSLPCSIAFGCVGFSLTGFGLSTLLPTIFSSAGHIPGGAHAGTSIAIVSMFTNSGAIVSAPLIGVMSDGFGSMRIAFLCDAILLGLLVPLSWGIPEETNIFKRATSISSDDVRSKLHVVADGANA